MTLSGAEVLRGAFLCLLQPLPPESVGDFLKGRIGVIGLIAFLAAQEAERGAAVRAAENEALRQLFRDVVADGDAGPLEPRLAELSRPSDGALTLESLDAANDALGAALIDLHERAECDGPRTLEHRIVALMVAHSAARELTLPG